MFARHSTSSIVVRTLQQLLIRSIWGYPGGSVLGVYDALYHSKMHHILTKDEQAAVLAATASFKSSNSIGVCIVTSGPGITNSITGIASAHSDAMPILILSGQVPVKCLGKRSFQECDAISLTKICTKHNFPILKATRTANILAEAFYQLVNSKPAPVLVDFPKDVSKKVLLHDGNFQLAKQKEKKELQLTIRFLRSYEQSKVKLLLLSLLTAKRPLLYVGGGASYRKSSKVLKRVLGLLSLPSVNTLMGINVRDSSVSLGMVGMHGQRPANLVMYHCDLLVAIGSRFDDRVIGNILSFNLMPRRSVLINADSFVRPNITLDLRLKGQLLDNLIRINCALSSTREAVEMKNWNGWLRLIRHFRNRCEAPNAFRLNTTMRVAKSSSPKNLSITTDVGQHQMLVAKNYGFCSGNTWMSSGGLGAMGSGLPFAIGLAAAEQFSCNLCFCGDGSFLMSSNELLTAQLLSLNIILFVVDNQSLGMVRQWQQVEHSGRYSQSEVPSSLRVSELSESYGHSGEDIRTVNSCVPITTEASNQKKTSHLLALTISKDESVWPMVQSGKSITNMLLNHKDIC